MKQITNTILLRSSILPTHESHIDFSGEKAVNSYAVASTNSSRGQRQRATWWDEVEGPLQGKVGQASVGTAVAHSHYCSSTALEEKGRSRHMATVPRLPLVPCNTHPGRPGSARRHHSQFALLSRVAGQSSKTERCCRLGTGHGWKPGVRGRMGGCRG